MCTAETKRKAGGNNIMRITETALQKALWGKYRKDIPAWFYAELPEGRQEIPSWAKGLHVNWNEQYGNPPDYKLKVIGDARTWPDKRFELRGDNMWIAEHPDGRAEVYYQTAVGMKRDKVKRWRDAADGSLHKYPRTLPRVEDETGSYCPNAPGEWVDIETMCTVQQEGFGGAHIDITMKDGSQITLRGPWAGGAPTGYIDVSYQDVTCQYFKSWKGTPWYARGGVGGLFITHDLFERLFARFQPHLFLANVNEGLGFQLQAINPHWGEPKAWRFARATVIRQNFQWAALAKAEQPPFPSCRFQTSCKGKQDCAGSGNGRLKDSHPSCERRSIDD